MMRRLAMLLAGAIAAVTIVAAQPPARAVPRLWTDEALADVREPLRQLLGWNLMRQRLAPDLESDDAAWFSKTGSFLHLRHEAGVLEHADGGVFAIAALSESSVPAQRQAGAEQALGHAARIMHDHLRGWVASA